MAVPQREMTLEEFLTLPEEEPALEFEDKRVTQKVSPKGRHSLLQFQVAEWINQMARPGKLACAFPELRSTFGGHSYVPDLSVYRWERIPSDSQGRVADDFLESPDIAVEVASPEQSVNALVRRCLWYVANGVSIAVLIDPADESVLLFRPDHVPEPVHGQDRIDLNDVLPGFTLTPEDLFASLRLR